MLALGLKSGGPMEALAKLTRLNGKLVTLVAILVVAGLAFAVLAGLSAEQQEELLWFIQDYLPRQLSEKEVAKAIAEAIAETGASSIRDMGRVMARLKTRHTGRMDFARAGTLVKSKLG